MIYDNDYYDLMALAEGYSAEDVDCFGGNVLLEVVNMSAAKQLLSKEMSDCKKLHKMLHAYVPFPEYIIKKIDRDEEPLHRQAYVYIDGENNKVVIE